jgi:hypothetical protein
MPSSDRKHPISADYRAFRIAITAALLTPYERATAKCVTIARDLLRQVRALSTSLDGGESGSQSDVSRPRSR